MNVEDPWQFYEKRRVFEAFFDWQGILNHVLGKYNPVKFP